MGREIHAESLLVDVIAGLADLALAVGRRSEATECIARFRATQPPARTPLAGHRPSARSRAGGRGAPIAGRGAGPWVGLMFVNGYVRIRAVRRVGAAPGQAQHGPVLSVQQEAGGC